MNDHIYRFFGSQLSSGMWAIARDEINHLAKVLRIQLNDIIEVCDGSGQYGTGKVVTLSSQEVLVEMNELHYDPPNIAKIHLYIGALKPQTLDELIPPLTEAGVSTIGVFLQSSVAKKRVSEKNFERWRRITRSSIKQCKRSWLPTLDIYNSLNEIISNLCDQDNRFYLSQQDSTHTALNVPMRKGSVHIIVGGEVGFHDNEIKELKSVGFVPITLGQHIMRSTTAALLATSICNLRQSYHIVE